MTDFYVPACPNCGFKKDPKATPKNVRIVQTLLSGVGGQMAAMELECGCVIDSAGKAVGKDKAIHSYMAEQDEAEARVLDQKVAEGQININDQSVGFGESVTNPDE